MKRIGRKIGKTGKTGKISSALAAALLVILAMAHPARSMAQAPASASIHGHVTNPAGMALNKGEVRLSTDRTADAKDRKYQYKFPIDPNGDYKGAGIAPGNYVVFVFQDDKSLDFNESVVFANGDDKLLNFDMTRPDYLAKMSPEDRKVLEEYKKKNAEIVAANSKVQNLNAMLTQARADNKAGNYDAAITAMQQATTTKPDEGIPPRSRTRGFSGSPWVTRSWAARTQPQRQPRQRELRQLILRSRRSTTPPPLPIKKALS